MKKKDNKLTLNTKTLFAFRWQGLMGDFTSTDPTTTTVTITTSATTLTGIAR
ncbi:hypothetical protein POKO110462_13320 [Pontibacter korlensis]|uniref:hypothetical protein n=1 Tax=Pontibacter korlensis TaxID=400092 RepID=UPI000AF11CCB|nr:hypothetical protein [Pontibacter korlensis]